MIYDISQWTLLHQENLWLKRVESTIELNKTMLIPPKWPTREDDDSSVGSGVPSGELTFCHGKSPFLMGKSTINGNFQLLC